MAKKKQKSKDKKSKKGQKEKISVQKEAQKAAVEEAGEEVSQEAIREKNKSVPNDKFDWKEQEEEVVVDYSEKERKELEKLYAETLSTFEKNDIVTGKVVGITDNDVILNIGLKADGLVPLNEFRDMPELEEGDNVEVFIEEVEDEKGQIVLSRRKAKLLRAWEEIQHAYENDKVVEGTITAKTKGGLIAEIHGYECFLPGSQIDVKPIVDYDYYVGKSMEFKVVKINEAIMNAVVSHKALIESELESQRQEIISKLEKGQVLEGTIKNITDFGAFIDLGGVDGLLYLSDISWGRISHPTEVLELNQKLNVVVLDFDDEKKRISLGLKQLQPHPWDNLPDEIKEGAEVKGKVVNIEDYGAFLEIQPGVEGLVHVSEISWSLQPIDPKEYFTLGDVHKVKVATLDKEERKMSLSIKRLQPDPWEKVEDKYPEGSKDTGKVINLTPYGAFVELEEGIGGLVHISDFSWTKKVKHPSEFTKVGADMEVVVLDIDKENRRLSLGHKQVEEDPWDTFESVFPQGTVHQGTIRNIEGNEVTVRLQYGLETTVKPRDIKGTDGSLPKEGDVLDFKVVRFDKEDRKIVVSHKKLIEEERKKEVKKKTKKQKKQKPQQSQKKRSKKKGKKKKRRKKPPVEKSKLGDLEVLSELKEKMEEGEESEEKKDSKKKDTKKGKKKSKKKSKKKGNSGKKGKGGNKKSSKKKDK